MIVWSWKEVDDLEAQNKFKEALFLMHRVWLQEPANLKVYLRMTFLAWYVLVERPFFDEIDMDDEDFDECLTLVRSLLFYGEEHFEGNAYYQWMIGYTMYMFPHIYGDYDRMEAKSREMLKKAYILFPEDPLIKMCYFDNRDHYKRNLAYSDLYEEVALLVPIIFPGNSSLESYFRSTFIGG